MEMSLGPIAPEDESGGPYVLAIVHDITNRNRAKEFSAQLLRHLSLRGASIRAGHYSSSQCCFGTPRAAPGSTRGEAYSLRARGTALLAWGKIIFRCVNTGGKR